MEAEAFSALVANIYDAALDPPSWRSVLKDVCAFVRGGPSASLFWQDAVKRTGKTYYVWGGEARFNQLYWDKYVTLNPFTAAAGHFPVEEVYSAADVLPLPQFVETPFYKEWMTPQGWCDVLSANLDKSPTSRAVFSVARHARDGMVDDERRGQRNRAAHEPGHVHHGAVGGGGHCLAQAVGTVVVAIHYRQDRCGLRPIDEGRRVLRCGSQWQRYGQAGGESVAPPPWPTRMKPGGEITHLRLLVTLTGDGVSSRRNPASPESARNGDGGC